jgi:hypothetical protein
MRNVKVKMIDEQTNEVYDVVGLLKESNEDNIVLILPEGGEMVISKDDIAGVTDVVVRLPHTEKKGGKKEKVVLKEGELKPLKVGSMLEKVVLLCKANPNATRKELIAMIVETGIMKSSAGASTYHQMAKPYLVETKTEEVTTKTEE